MSENTVNKNDDNDSTTQRIQIVLTKDQKKKPEKTKPWGLKSVWISKCDEMGCLRVGKSLDKKDIGKTIINYLYIRGGEWKRGWATPNGVFYWLSEDS